MWEVAHYDLGFAEGALSSRIPEQQKIFRTSRRTAIGPVAFAIVLLLSVVTTPAAQAQTYTVIHNFSGAEGAYPDAGLTPDKSGDFYGTAPVAARGARRTCSSSPIPAQLDSAAFVQLHGRL